jgi:hypothetical protein
MKLVRKTVLAAALPTLAAIAAGPARGEEEVNNGQDPTKPLTRIDLRYQYQNAPPATNDNVHIVTPRADKPFPLGGGWSLSGRVDLPLFVTEIVNPDNPGGARHSGMGDVLLQGLLIKAESKDFAWAVGAQAIFPTASEDGMGGGKYRLVPTVGARWNTPGLGAGAWFAALARYDFDVAGKDNRRHVSELQLAPIVNLALPNRWFVNFFPSSDIRYNFADERPGDTGKWFVPFNAMIGRMVDRSTVASLEVGVPIVDDYVVYDFKLEARIGFFF